jgi:hypothetical protein
MKETTVAKYIYIMGLLAFLLCLGAAYYAGRSSVKPVETVREVKGETKVVEHTVTVTKVVKPDGTVTTVTTTDDKAVDKKTDSIASSPVAVQPGWSLGVAYRPDLAHVLTHQWDAWEVTGGRRLLGNSWVDATLNPLRKEVSIGIRYEF